ncbi:unnamed protein product [Symbiodinium natans]|uniref:Uncharacterized protein n=1 Tax=Symbiodinium natans TaxID=878477 RepID=A0A812I9Q4_9DINO|nr:unnamed protein product [Symbiodinium natans]
MDVFSLLRRGLSGDVCESLSFAPLREVAPLVHSFTASLPEALLENCRAEHLEVDLVRLGQLLAARFLNECLQLQRASSQMRDALELASERTETLPEAAELAKLRARCQELERELEERPRSSSDADEGTLDEAEALRAALGAPQPCTRCEALEAKLREQEERMLDHHLEAPSNRSSPRFKAAPADPDLARLLVGEAPPVVRKRAAVVLQAAWRRRAAALRFERHLVGLVFPTRNDGRRPSGTVGSVRLAQALAARVFRGLQRHGLDFEAAFRCADTGYEGNHEPSGLIRVGQFLLFLCRQQGVALAPAESAALLRLLKRRDRGNRKDPPKLPSGARADLQEAWQWEMPYDFARQLQAAACEGGPAPAREALEAVSALLRGRQCRFQWGDQGASWDRLVRDALLLQLREERERLQAATAAQDDRSSSYADGQTNRPFAPFTGELEGQLADCEAEMKEVLQGPSRPVSATALTARLLREQLPLAPVTLHAAARAAPPWQPNNGIGDGVRRGQVIDHLCGQQDLKGSLIGGFVRFQQSLPASPSLIHITAIRPVWTIRIKELSERGMLLQILPMTPGTGWKDDLQLAYCAGSAEGVLHVGPSQGGRSLQVREHFIPRLTRTPELVFLQSYARTAKPEPKALEEPRPPEAVTCQLGTFAVAASLPGDGEGLSLRAIQTAKHVEETAVRAALGRVTLAITADQDALQVKAQWKASEAKPAKAVEDHSGQGQTFQDLVSRVRVVRSSPRGFAVLLHRDAKMIQLWYEAISSESTATAEALQTLAPLPLDLEDSQEDSALRAKGLAALGLESNEHPLNPLHVPDTPNDPWNARFAASQSGLSLLDSEGTNSHQFPPRPGGDSQGHRPLMVVEQPMAPRAKKFSR